MKIERLNLKGILLQLRTVAALLALALSSLSVPLALANTSSDVCSMTCCVEDGYCCCNPRRSRVEGQADDGHPRVGSFQIFASCPQGCTPSQSFSHFSFRDAVRNASYNLESLEAAISYSRQLVLTLLPLEHGSSPPRAPPVS